MSRSCDPARPEMTKVASSAVPSDSTTTGWKRWVPCKVAYLASLRCAGRRARLSGRTAQIRVCHSADDSCVPSKGFALFPWHQSEAVRTFAIWAWEAIGFFGDRYACRDQRTCNQIIKSVVSGCSPWSFLANKAMDPSGTDQWPTLALMWHTQAQTQPQTNTHSHHLIVKPQATRSDWHGKKPISTVGRGSCQERCSAKRYYYYY